MLLSEKISQVVLQLRGEKRIIKRGKHDKAEAFFISVNTKVPLHMKMNPIELKGLDEYMVVLYSRKRNTTIVSEFSIILNN